MSPTKTRFTFTVYRLPFTVRYPFTVICDQWLRPALRNFPDLPKLFSEGGGEGGAKGKGKVKGKGPMVNGFAGGKA